MAHLNQCIFMGRVVRDPNLRKTNSGESVVNVPIAIPRLKKDDPADFLDVTFWKKNAEYVAKYIMKGDMITVTGELNQQNWQEKDGTNRNKHFLNFANVCGYVRSRENSTEYGEGGNTFTEVYNDVDDESMLPF